MKRKGTEDSKPSLTTIKITSPVFPRQIFPFILQINVSSNIASIIYLAGVDHFSHSAITIGLQSFGPPRELKRKKVDPPPPPSLPDWLDHLLLLLYGCPSDISTWVGYTGPPFPPRAFSRARSAVSLCMAALRSSRNEFSTFFGGAL
jgi:hypothetical protein